jgi:flagellar biosynthesis protein FliP
MKEKINTIFNLFRIRRHLLNPFRDRPVRLILFLLIAILLASPDIGSSAGLTIPSLNLSLEKTDDPGKVAVALEIIALLTILSLAPAILILMTSFTRIVIVFHFLRQAMGTQQSPPNQIIIGLSLFLTFFIMTPVWQNIYQNALRPYLDEKMTYQEAFTQAQTPLRKFMLKNTREKDLALFVKAAKVKHPQTPDDLSLLTLIPAFVISELKTAFIIGFVLYIPFLIIDMVVASVLLSMGMMMLPPIMISLPFKLMLFVLVDGWHMIVGSMLNSFGMFMI